jgi:hypothetical protein
MLSSILLASVLGSNANAEDLSGSDTSYIGATMLEGDVDVTFAAAAPLNPEDNPNSYNYFTGNTLYIGNSDDAGNSVDAIIEFFWFQSSIDRGSDFYVAVIKARATPAQSDSLWVTDWNDWDWDSPPVLSVEAMTDVNRENGAFRWDWAVPFENYGIDAYGQVSIGNSYGIGLNGEGAVMAHGEYPITEDGSVKASGDVQAKGFLNTEYVVKSQYEITLYEWDVFVNGRADLMAWDVYLNLEARAEQSAYHEYFVSIQVEEGETFTMDELNISANFDSSWWPWSGAHELGVTISNLEISAPFWFPEEEEEEEEEEEIDIPEEEEEEEVEQEEEEEEVEQPEGDDGFEDDTSDLPGLENEASEPVDGGCSVVGATTMGGLGLAMLLVAGRRRED